MRLYALSVLLAALALAGCGGGASDEAGPALTPAAAAEALARAPGRLREAGPFAFASEVAETHAEGEEPRGTFVATEGAIDLAGDAGHATIDLTRVVEGLEQLRNSPDPPDEQFEAFFGGPVEVWWDERQVYVHAGDLWGRGPRSALRDPVTGSLVLEPVQLAGLLPLARNVSVEGTTEVDGERTTHVAFTVDAGKAHANGVPSELLGGQGLYGPALAVEAWLDGTGLPRRLAYTLQTKERRYQGKVAIPAKTIRVEYDLSRFGDDLDIEPPHEARTAEVKG